MRVTGTGHAGMLIETAAGSILCDPWVNPAYFASWFPFPDNSGLDWDTLGACDYLYVSHLHRDHFDAEHLRRYVSKRATVLLPAYPTSDLEDELRALGFRSFLRTRSGEPVTLDGGLSVMIQALVSPTDGPIGDSSIWVEHDGVRLLNQNDARPRDLTAFAELGHVHAHLLQFSGAIWYPMVYELPAAAKRAFGRQKRERQFDRTLRYVNELGASWVFPIAGPPCFLDEELWGVNDLFGDEGNIFPDQQDFIEHYERLGHRNGVVLLPGTTATVTPDACEVEQPVPDVAAFFAGKEEYLRAYQRRQRPVIEAARASWRHPEVDVLAGLTERVQPLMARSEHIARGIGGPVRFDLTDDAGAVVQSIVFDFTAREVRTAGDERARYRFRTRRSLIEHLLVTGEADWVNSLFLSCRFSAARVGQYNEYVYTFFKCLSDDRLQYAEGWYAEQTTDVEDIVIGDWAVQGLCPHLKANLARFGKLDDTVLTCQMHGWKFDLPTGRCVTSAGHPIRARRVDEPQPAG
ncbi:Rieske 2Fe-2S domain-containing protein [Dactylosporangium sp. NPDC050688]|uniref:Rieske 2Fe-2S domain-containing protein n=1 Tax=Dactylosporangium sp. NPDC050688 TaxID=3157217 RepID=UPI0033F393E2